MQVVEPENLVRQGPDELVPVPGLLLGGPGHPVAPQHLVRLRQCRQGWEARALGSGQQPDGRKHSAQTER